MATTVRVEGLRETVRGLERAGVEVADLKDVFGRIAAEGAETGAGFTPTRTGRLARSARGNKAKNRAVVMWGRASVPWAGPILFGWPRRGIKAAATLRRTDDVMEVKAPRLLEDGIGDMLHRYGLQ